MKHNYQILNTLLPFFILFLFSCGGEGVNLSFKVKQGDTYDCEVKMDQKISTSLMGMNMNIDQQMEISQTLQVDGILENGNILLNNTMNRFFIKQSMPMMGMPIDIEFDTDKPEKAGAMGESMGQYFSKMKGMSYLLELDTTAKLIKSNMEEVMAKLGLDSLNTQGGNNSGGNNADQYLVQLPSKALKKGDSYEIITDNPGTPFGTKNTYTVKEIRADIVVFDLKSEFLTSGEQKDGVEVSDIKGEQTGTVEIDRATGMTLKSEISQTIEMKVSAQGMKVPMKTTGTVLFTATKK